MEETIRFLLLNQEKFLKISQVYNITPLLQDQSIKQIRLPMELKLFKINISVLHTCLYYVISIQKNICWGTSVDFREKCLCSISNYYIKRRMSFQIYQYAYLSSKILSLPLEKVMHIIYYMVYARLASKPYISHLIAQAKNKNNIRRFQKKCTQKSENNQSIHSRSVDSRHYTVFMESNHMELDLFRKDIKQVLNIQGQLKKSSKKNDNKRYFNIKNIYPDQNQFYEDGTEGYTNNLLFGDQEPKIINIPLKVGAMDNSSVISRLKVTSSNSSTKDFGRQKKIQMRRQKFNEDFDCSKKYDVLGKYFDRQNAKRNEWGSKSGAEDFQKANSHFSRIQKQQYDYYNLMASDIKCKNKQLDLIRQQCVSQTLKKHTMRQYDWNKYGKEVESKASNANKTPQLEVNKSFYEKQNKNQQGKFITEEKKIDLKSHQQDMINQEAQKMSKTTGVIANQNTYVCQDDKLILFNKKVKNKFKLHKYKIQYRNFLKTAIFDQQNCAY